MYNFLNDSIMKQIQLIRNNSMFLNVAYNFCELIRLRNAWRLDVYTIFHYRYISHKNKYRAK